MTFIINDLSFHAQFHDLASFSEAIGRVMEIRGMARRFGHPLHCHRNLGNAQVTPALSMLQAVRFLSMEQRRALLQWMTQLGPFWDDARTHGPDDYLECNGEVVTDTAVGEAAVCCLNGIERRLVSMAPSSWMYSPVPVTWVLDSENTRAVDIANYWETNVLEAALQAAPATMDSWEGLAQAAQVRCTHLTFLAESFTPLRGHPFVEGAAQRLLILLATLNRFRGEQDEQGQRTNEGHRLYQNHFTGKKAWFTDSSETEKHDFRKSLTFRLPTGDSVFCPWHGKVKTPQFRIHFTWPIPVGTPLYIVYVGPKITKR